MSKWDKSTPKCQNRMTGKQESHLEINGSSENGWFAPELHKCKSPEPILSEKKRTNFFVTFFFLKCYIVERGKMPVGDAGRKAATGAEFRKGGKQMWIMSFL